MRKFVIAGSLVAITMAAPAQQVLQCVNPDVLNSLVFNARPESRIIVKRSMPDIVAGYRAPASFTLVGSSVRGVNAATTVAYKTTLQAQPAFDQLLAFLSAEGWKPEPPSQPAFSVAATQPTAALLCRDGERRSVNVRAIDGVRYATISSVGMIDRRDCGVPEAALGVAIANTAARANAARANLPRFSFPASATMVAAPPGGDANGNSVVSSSARVQTEDAPASLLRHLARQLDQQGWRSDAGWSGSLGAGSAWSRRSGEGQVLLGTLEVMQVGAGIYEVGFTMTGASQPGLM